MLTVQSRYCQYCAMWYSSFVLWTNLCNRLVRYILIRVPRISAQLLCAEIKIPLGLYFNTNISYLLKHIFKYPCTNESVAMKCYIRQRKMYFLPPCLFLLLINDFISCRGESPASMLDYLLITGIMFRLLHSRFNSEPEIHLYFHAKEINHYS